MPSGVVVGLDLDDEKIHAAREASVHLDNLMFVRAEPGEIPWQEKFFSHVIVEKDDLPAAEIERVLADGGQVLKIG